MRSVLQTATRFAWQSLFTEKEDFSEWKKAAFCTSALVRVLAPENAQEVAQVALDEEHFDDALELAILVHRNDGVDSGEPTFC